MKQLRRNAVKIFIITIFILGQFVYILKQRDCLQNQQNLA